MIKIALTEGSEAPNFSLKDKDGNTHSLEDFKSEYLVVYFYPKDNTPGCTLEGKEYTKVLPELKKLNADVVGISGGDEKSKTKFCEKQGIGITLLSDPDFSVSKSYDSYGKKAFMGRIFNGIVRNTFILKDGKVVKSMEKVKPQKHVEDVLEFLRNGGK